MTDKRHLWHSPVRENRTQTQWREAAQRMKGNSMADMTTEERAKNIAAKITIKPGNQIDVDFVVNITFAEIRQAEQAAYERAAMLYENIDPACDHERQNGDPGAGAMGAIIEYRDKIRALAKETEG